MSTATIEPDVEELESPKPFLIEFGNPAPQRCLVDGSETSNVHDHAPLDRDAPSVTKLHIPPNYTFDPHFNDPVSGERRLLTGPDLAVHLTRKPDITNLPDHEAALVATHLRGGMWNHHGLDTPSWVSCTHPELGKLLADFYGCEHIDPANEDFHRWKEEVHHTIFGPPGVGPATSPKFGPRALKVNAGNDIQSALLGGGQVDFVGQATASTATTLTRTGSTWTTNQWAGCRVYCTTSATNGVWGIVISNTATVLTVDRWYDPTNPGGAAGTTALSTGTFFIVGAGCPAAWFMGLTATATAPSGTDTALTGEITTAGLLRKICPYAHTAGVASFTLTPVFTAQAADVPITVAQMAVFNSMVLADVTLTMLFRTLLSATATLSAVGDQLTVTETVTE